MYYESIKKWLLIIRIDVKKSLSLIIFKQKYLINVETKLLKNS